MEGTPRVDAHLDKYPHGDILTVSGKIVRKDEYVNAEFARQLERENIELTTALRKLLSWEVLAHPRHYGNKDEVIAARDLLLKLDC